VSFETPADRIHAMRAPEADRVAEAHEPDLAEFAAVASHDLSAPLRVIAGYADLLGDRVDPTDPEVAAAMQGIRRGVDRMQSLVDGLLAYTRAADGTAAADPVDCAAVVQDTLDSLAPAIAEAHATVEVGELPTVLGFAGPLAQLFQNLIDNAVKFRGPEAPVIRIACEPEPGVWHFTVHDNGIGIEARDAVHIFEMFSRVRAVGRTPGSGIGLAVARRVVEGHGGQIWLESSPGAGSTFHFTIPRKLRRRDDPRVGT
jgi:signal transduction histidine kinase